MESGKISINFFGIKNVEQGGFSSPTEDIEWMIFCNEGDPGSLLRVFLCDFCILSSVKQKHYWVRCVSYCITKLLFLI